MCVAEAAPLVGKRVKVRVERVLDGVAYATLVRRLKKVPEPLTAEADAMRVKLQADGYNAILK